MNKFWRVFWDTDDSRILGGVFDTLEKAADMEMTDCATIVEVEGNEPVRAWRRRAGHYKHIGDRSHEEFQKAIGAMTADALAAGREPTKGPFWYGPDPIYSNEVMEPPTLEEVPLAQVMDGHA
jgi:hypothetical protein